MGPMDGTLKTVHFPQGYKDVMITSNVDLFRLSSKRHFGLKKDTGQSMALCLPPPSTVQIRFRTPKSLKGWAPAASGALRAEQQWGVGGEKTELSTESADSSCSHILPSVFLTHRYFPLLSIVSKKKKKKKLMGVGGRRGGRQRE